MFEKNQLHNQIFFIIMKISHFVIEYTLCYKKNPQSFL